MTKAISRREKIKIRAKSHKVDVHSRKINKMIDTIDKLEKRLANAEKRGNQL